MGVLKFRLTPPDLAKRMPELRKAFITGLDRTPERLLVELRQGMLICQRESPESGRLSVPWPVEGFGAPIVATATLAERAEPYDLAVELARGKLNDLRNQAADWTQMGLRTSTELELLMARSRKSFARAATARDDPARASAEAQESLEVSHKAGRLLIEAYTRQVLQRRMEGGARLPTHLGCALSGKPKAAAWSTSLLPSINSARVLCPWSSLEPAEGQFHWDEADAQLAWARRKRLTTSAGPLLDFRSGALPGWLWLWEGDFEAISGLVVALVRAAVGRYRGKVNAWHVVGRPASGEILGLSEDAQIRLTAKAMQAARQADPNAHFIVDFDRPWAEWMGASPFQLGPLHLADSLARAELGLAGVGLEVAPGFSAPGGPMRDAFDFSRMLDLYALLNLPLHVTLTAPSSASPDPKADKDARVEASQWPRTPDEALQREWAAEWLALAAAKPFVRSVTWLQATDSEPHLYPNAGLFRADDTPKPVLGVLKAFREKYLS